MESGTSGATAAAVRLARVALVIGVAACAALAGAASAAALNMTGSWKANYHCESGWCIGSDFPATDVLTQAEGSSVVTGSNGSESISATLSGNTLNYTSTTGGYEAKGTLTVSADGLSWVGPVTDNNGTSGTYTATRVATMVTLQGSVSYTNDIPAQGVTLKVSGTNEEGASVSKSVESSASGNYSVEVSPGEYTVTATGDPKEQNGGTLSVRKSPSAPNGPECDGKAKGEACAFPKLKAGEKGKANFTYTTCTGKERTAIGKPLSGCPIIFIPGFLGSRIFCSTGELWTHLFPGADFADMVLAPDGEHNAGTPGSCSATAGTITGQEGLVSSAAGADIYGNVTAFLNRIVAHGAGYPKPEEGAYAFPYDWRKSPLITLGELDKLVNEVLAKTGASHVVLMAHSMGGLVLRAYVGNAGYAGKVIRAVTLGTPYWGAPKSHTALLTSKTGTPKEELLGLDLFVNGADLQLAARNMQGLFWLYPYVKFGAWLKTNLTNASGSHVSGWLAGSEIDHFVSLLGGSSPLVDSAQAGHAAIDGFGNVNGVDYQLVVGVGEPTMTAVEVTENAWEPFQKDKVWFGSGDGTVPARSGTEGAFEGGSSPVPISYVCGVDHVSLPGNAEVEKRIEGFLLKGEAVNVTQECPYTGVETELYEPLLSGAAFRASATLAARVATAAGTMTLVQAAEKGLVRMIPNGANVIIVTNNHHPATLLFGGGNITLRVSSLTSAGTGLRHGSGPSHFYGPLSGNVTVTEAGSVERNGKAVKPVVVNRPPHTTAHVRRRGRFFLVTLTAKARNGVVATYYRIDKARARLYTKPLRLTASQLGKLRFASVDRFGKWERTARAR